MFWEAMSIEEFQDDFRVDQLGNWNGTILAILNLCVTVMPIIKFGSIRFMVWEMTFEEFQDGHHDNMLKITIHY